MIVVPHMQAALRSDPYPIDRALLDHPDQLDLEAINSILPKFQLAAGGVQWGTNKILRGPIRFWLEVKPQ